jgi:hypothetical protein
MAQPAPKFFYVADKSRKLLFQMEEKGGAPAAVREFECIHGRVEGDKQKEGDLKTPEGVYFITKVITQKLDFMEYGPYAVALNYPNPADRLRKKTGGGIWLHSKGQKITGITTRGCLAIDKGEIMEIAPLLKPGTPVIVAEKAVGAPFFGKDGKPLPVVCGEPAKTSPALPESKTEVFGKLTEGEASACVHAVEFPVSPSPAFCTVQTADAPRIRELTLDWFKKREGHDKAIIATIKPDMDEVRNYLGDDADDPARVKDLIQSEVDRINEPQPLFKKIGKVVIKMDDFDKTTAHKIKRYTESNKGE